MKLHRTILTRFDTLWSGHGRPCPRPQAEGYLRSLSFTQQTEELPYVVDEEVGSVLGGVVTAPIVEIPGDDVLVVAFGEGPDRLVVVGEVGQAERHSGGFGRHILSVGIFIVEACR